MASDTADIDLKDAPAPGTGDGESGIETIVCQEVDEFYSPAARESLGRFCERFLNENALTPTELLHSPRHQTTFSNQALFVATLQQAERAQGRRLGTMNPVVNEVARLTRERCKDWPIPELTPQTYAAVVGQVLSRDPTFTGRFIVDAALTQHIQTARTFSEKASMLLELAATTDDPDALAPVDRLLAEIVRSESGMASVSADLPFAKLVGAIAALVVGDDALADDAPPSLKAMETLLRRVPMPALCDGLLVAFRRELAKPDRFTIASIGDLFGVESVQREVMTIARYAERLRSGDGYLGGFKTEAAFQRRMALLINEDTLPEMVKGRNFVQKLRELFAIQKMPLTPKSEEAVTRYLHTYLDGREFAGRLLDCWKERTDKLKGLAEVQTLILDSRFPEEEREQLASQLDEVQSVFMRTQRLLAALTSKVEPSPDTVLDIVKLAAEGAFCAGKSRQAVARALYRQVHRPRFVRSFLLSAPSGKERAARATWLRNALRMVGVPFIDMGALRVLVVDDEDGPRSYVESVLHDLGVGSIDLAEDGQRALELMASRDGRYDLIVCDWMMPRLSGLEVLRRVRETAPELPFLMVTALATRQAVERAIASNVNAYIAKPFTPEQLEEKVFLVLTQRGVSAG